jgi:hypothetical protein
LLSQLPYTETLDVILHQNHSHSATCDSLHGGINKPIIQPYSNNAWQGVRDLWLTICRRTNTSLSLNYKSKRACKLKMTETCSVTRLVWEVTEIQNYGQTEVFYLTNLCLTKLRNIHDRRIKHEYGTLVEWFWLERTEVRIWIKTCYSATVSTENLTWIGLGSKHNLLFDRPETNIFQGNVLLNHSCWSNNFVLSIKE